MNYLVALIALILPTYLIRFSIGGIPTTLLEIAIYLIFIYGAANIAYSHWLKTKRKFWLPVAILLLGALISVYISPDKTASLGQFKALIIDPLLVFWLMLVYLEAKDFSLIFYGLCGSAAFVSIHTIVLKILGHTTSDGRVVGIFGYSPNYISLFLVPVVAMALVYGIKQRAKFLAMLSFLLVASGVVAVYFSGSRGGLLAIGGGFGFFLILNYWDVIKEKIWLKVVVALLIIACIGSAWWAFKPNFSATAEGRQSTSNNIRWEIWKSSLELVKKHPVLGVGLANYQRSFGELTKDRVNFPEYITPLALTPHNIFLTFYLEIGLIGLVAFVWFLIIFYKIGFKNIKSDVSKILLVGMTALLLQGLVDTPYFKNDLALMWWLIFGLMMLINKKE